LCFKRGTYIHVFGKRMLCKTYAPKMDEMEILGITRGTVLQTSDFLT
jgi:hypothetical protein